MRIGHDVESYVNYFCVGIENYENDEKILFELSEERNDIHKIYEYYRNLSASVVSFNGVYYDNLMIKYILYHYSRIKDLYWHQITMDLKAFSDVIIEDDNFNRGFQTVKRMKHPWVDVDLFLYWSKGLRLSKKISLKSLGIQLGYDVVQELPFSPTSVLQWKDLPRLREYNLVHDLGILRLLYENMKKDVELREYVQSSLGIQCMSMDAPKIASEVLLKDYCDRHRYNVWDVRKWKFERQPLIPIESVLRGFDPKFETKQFIDLFERWKQSYDKVGEEFIYKEGITEVILTFGIGGLHSVNENEKYYSTETHIVKTSDVASLYPNLIINYRCIRFPDVLEKYKNVMIERLIAKANKEKTKDTFFKLILNSISGLLDDANSWLYFPEGALRMRLIGQLILSKFIEKCAMAGWKVVSANTDGIEVVIPKEDEERYESLLNETVKMFDMSLEHETYDFIIYKNVNNYLAKTSTGDIKQKGLFVEKPVLGNSVDNLIIAKALKAYYVDDIPFEHYVSNPGEFGNHIFDYCKSNKIGKQYLVMWGNNPQQRLNRYYFSKSKPYLMKHKINPAYSHTSIQKLMESLSKTYSEDSLDQLEDKATRLMYNTPPQHVNVGESVELYNRHIQAPIKEYDINYTYYIKQCRNIVDIINNLNQLTLF